MKGLFRHIDKSAKQKQIGGTEELKSHTQEHLDLTTKELHNVFEKTGVDLTAVKNFDKATRGRRSTKQTLYKGQANGSISNDVNVEKVGVTHLVQKSEVARLIKAEDRIKNRYHEYNDQEHSIPSNIPEFLATMKNIREGQHGDFLKKALQDYDYKKSEAKLQIARNAMTSVEEPKSLKVSNEWEKRHNEANKIVYQPSLFGGGEHYRLHEEAPHTPVHKEKHEEHPGQLSLFKEDKNYYENAPKLMKRGKK